MCPPLFHNLPLVSREWKTGSNSSYNCTPFLQSLLTKGKRSLRLSLQRPPSGSSVQSRGNRRRTAVPGIYPFLGLSAEPC